MCSRFFALPKKMMEIYARRGNNYSGCLYEAEGWPYRFLIVPDGRRYEWKNATLETKTYDFGDGTGRTFQYCKELVDVFRKHTMGYI